MLISINDVPDKAIPVVSKTYDFYLRPALDKIAQNADKSYRMLNRITDIRIDLTPDMSVKRILTDNPEYLNAPFSNYKEYMYRKLTDIMPDWRTPEIAVLFETGTAGATVREAFLLTACQIHDTYVKSIGLYTSPGYVREMVRVFTGDSKIFNKKGTVDKQFICNTKWQVQENRLTCMNPVFDMCQAARTEKRYIVVEAMDEFLTEIFGKDCFYDGWIPLRTMSPEEIVGLTDNDEFLRRCRYPDITKKIIEYVRTSDAFAERLAMMSDSTYEASLMHRFFHDEILKLYDLSENKRLNDSELYAFMRDNGLAFDVIGNLIHI